MTTTAVAVSGPRSVCSTDTKLIETNHRGTQCARSVADLVSSYLGWDDERIRAEVATYEARVQAERESQTQQDDLAAGAARIMASDTRAVAVARAVEKRRPATIALR